MQVQVNQTKHSRVVEQSPVYYGWIILVVGTIGLIMSSPGQTYSISIFIERFIEDLGISRSLVSTLYAVGTVTASLSLPLIGRLIDQRGSRFMVIVIAIAFGLVCMYMGTVRNALMLGVGFVGVRMLGQGSMSLVSRNVINQWWVSRRGAIMGISTLFAAVLGTGSFPRLIDWLINNFGWRTAYPMLGGMVMMIMVPVGYLFFRNRPEMYGLEPDGGMISVKTTADGKPVVEENWTVQQVVRTRAFWLIVLGTASFDMLGTGITFHVVSIFADNGLDPQAAAYMFLPMSIATASVGLLSGFIIDYIEAKYLLMVELLLFTVTLLLATVLITPVMVTIYGIIFGCTSGIGRALSSVVWANYFGRENLGTISGVTFLFGAAASGLGPLWFGVMRDTFDSYTLGLYIAAAVVFVLAMLALTIKRPRLADYE